MTNTKLLTLRKESSVALPRTSEEWQVLAEAAIQAQNNFSLGICYLRALLSRTSFAEQPDIIRKHIARKIWDSILKKATTNSLKFLSLRQNGNKKRGLAQISSRKDMLRQALRAESVNATYRGLLDKVFKQVDEDLAGEFRRMLIVGQCDVVMDRLLDLRAGPLTDEALLEIQQRLA